VVKVFDFYEEIEEFEQHYGTWKKKVESEDEKP